MNRHTIGKLLLAMVLLTIGFLNGTAQTSHGKASYYARKFNGARTASGERLHPDSMTCAHRSYAFGTLLKVTNVNTGKSVVVRVNDRGPFVKGRIIDLSYRAAKELGIISQGIATVMVEPYKKEVQVPLKDESEQVLPELDFDLDVPIDPHQPVWKKADEEKGQKDAPEEVQPETNKKESQPN